MRMIFKAPGKHLLHEVMVDFKVVEDADIDAHYADGWFPTPVEADAAYKSVIAQVEKEDTPVRLGRPPKVK
jgi:hypothetical protein